MKLLAFLSLLVTLAAAGCALPSHPSEAATAAGFTVAAWDGEITLRNESPSVVHYVLIEEETATRVDLYFDPTQWPSVAPGETVRVAYEDVNGYGPNAERAVVYWHSADEYGPPLRVRFR